MIQKDNTYSIPTCMKHLLKILLYTVLSIVAFIFFGLSAAFALDIHYGREAHSHERLVKKAGRSGLDYSLVESAIDTINCYPLGDFVQCRYVIQFQDTTAQNKRTSTWSISDDNGIPIKWLSHFDYFLGSQVVEITGDGQVIINADYPVGSLSADYYFTESKGSCFPPNQDALWHTYRTR